MLASEKSRISALHADSLQLWNPPEDLTVDEWADKYRKLDGGLSAEAGQWRTSRTPYMREPMRAFTDPRVEEITVVSPSQVGKSELELNCINYIIDQDPGTILYVHPTVEAAKEFSKLRLEPNLRSTPRLREKVKDAKSTGRTASATQLMKSFPGGMISLVGSNSASGLSSKPCRYIVADELDRWALSAGRDGDPWELAKKRQTTFFNRKRVAVSTPTIKGASQIEFLYYRGTMERYKTQCPHCGEYHEIKFDDIKFTSKAHKVASRLTWSVNVIGWQCPGCGGMVDEKTAKRQPCRWEADNPEALENNRARSFWLNGFVSPWSSWEGICKQFCEARNDPERLQVFKNTTLGELWEMRTLNANEDEMMQRAEKYPEDADLPGEAGSYAAPLVLTCGVDCQHTYLQYEVVGWSRFGESWGIKTGYIQGSPDEDAAWQQLDSIISRVYRFKNGRGLRVSLTFVDSGDGNYTNEIAKRTAARQSMNVFAIKGDGKMGKPFINPPTKQAIDQDKRRPYWLYTIGVNAGKAAIMASAGVKEPGANYMHTPVDDGRGYDLRWYTGLLSEVEVTKGNVIKWEKLPGHERNEPLDCRNYARAAMKVLNPDFESISKALKSEPKEKKKVTRQAKPRTKNKVANMFD